MTEQEAQALEEQVRRDEAARAQPAARQSPMGPGMTTLTPLPAIDLMHLERRLTNQERLMEELVRPHLFFGEDSTSASSSKLSWGKATADWISGSNTIILTPCISQTNSASLGNPDVTCTIYSPSGVVPGGLTISTDDILGYLPFPNAADGEPKGLLMPVLGAGSGLFPVLLVYDSGDDGTDTVECSYAYNCYAESDTGHVTALNGGTATEPDFREQLLGSHAQATTGWGRRIAGVFHLVTADETVFCVPCVAP
jgi:hypothetical protein